MKNEELAFPSIMSDYNENTGGIMSIYSDGGMTLRDYFAGQALAGILAYPETPETPSVAFTDFNPVVVAERSYAFANAMIAERKKSEVCNG